MVSGQGTETGAVLLKEIIVVDGRLRMGRGGRVVNARATRPNLKRVRNSRSTTSQPVTFGSRGFESYPRRLVSGKRRKVICQPRDAGSD